MTTIEITVDTFDSLLNRIQDMATESGRQCQRSIDSDNKLFAKNDEIASLKAKLAKYEPVPGFPIPFTNIAHQLTPDEKCKLLVKMVAHNAAGEKINAIKVCRELTGAGLKEAKDCVEAAFAVETPIKGNANVAAVENLIRLVKNNPDEKIAMIKEVRAICGSGLKEAKDAVEYSMGSNGDSAYLGGGKYKLYSSVGGRW